MNQEFFHEGDLVSVQTAQPIDRAGLQSQKAAVWARLSSAAWPRKVLGVVWGAGKGDFDYKKRCAGVIRVFDVAPMADEMRQFLIKAADYTPTPMNAMLRLATRAPGLGDAPSMRKVYRLGTDEPTRMTDARAKVLGVLRDYGGLAFTLKRSRSAGVTTSVVRVGVKLGAVSEARAICRHTAIRPWRSELTNDQAGLVPKY
jgi:primosomal protein N' (replication factor Y)